MTIKRAPRPETNFYMLDKAISEDGRLSWEARGLLIFLLGKPDHWEVSVNHLIRETSGAIRKRTKRDGIYAILKELEQAGYLSREQSRDRQGSFTNASYVVHESPHAENAVTGKQGSSSPRADYPYTDNPCTANTTLVSIEGLASIEKAESIDVAQGVSPAAQTGVIEAEDDPRPRHDIPADMPGPKDGKAKTFRPWANYAIAYRRRYGVWPIWNARVAGQMSQLVDRVGADLAPGVAAYFLGMNTQFYVTKGHPVGLMLQDCEAIATAMQTGQQMTATRARQMDGTQANLSAADEAKRLLGATWEN